MFKQILFIVLFMFSALNISAGDVTLTPADDVPLPDMPTLPTRPRVQQSMAVTSVSVDQSNTDLYLNFAKPEGLSVITIKDSNGSVVQREFVDTDSEEDLLLPIDNMDSGNYTITIISRTKPLKGEFKIQK